MKEYALLLHVWYRMLDDRNLVSTGLGDMPSYNDVFSWSVEDQKHGDSSLQRCHCRQMQVASEELKGILVLS